MAHPKISIKIIRGLVIFLAIFLLSACAQAQAVEIPTETSEPGKPLPTQVTPAVDPTAQAEPEDKPAMQPLAEWQRSGGIAGICRQLTLYPDGNYILLDCREKTPLREGKLSGEQMGPFNDLAARYGAFRYEFKPPKQTADMFSDWYTFNGSGQETPTDEEMAEINNRLALLASEVSRDAPPQSSGIRGKVLIGPNCPGPVIEGDTQCEEMQPYQAELAILDAQGNPVKEVLSTLEGTFQVALQPGKYVVRPVSPKRFPFAPEQTVTISGGQWVEITILYDTGIR